MSALPCVSNFDNGFDQAWRESLERDRRDDLVNERMKALNADSLQDALDTAGSFHKFFALAAKLMAQDNDEENLHLLYCSVLEDVKALVYAEENESTGWRLEP